MSLPSLLFVENTHANLFISLNLTESDIQYNFIQVRLTVLAQKSKTHARTCTHKLCTYCIVEKIYQFLFTLHLRKTMYLNIPDFKLGNCKYYFVWNLQCPSATCTCFFSTECTDLSKTLSRRNQTMYCVIGYKYFVAW